MGATVPKSLSDDSNNHPTLKTIPTLPFAGSFIPAYSGTPAYSPSSVYHFWPEMKRRFGKFYRMGMPVVGEGLHGTLHVIQDPKEMMKLLRSEGEYPIGSTAFLWPPNVFGERHPTEIPSLHLLGHGPEWKRIRRFAQTDLLAPKSARRYMPAAIEAVYYSSKGAPDYADRMNDYSNLASFDMFVNIFLGHLPRITDPTTKSDPEDVEFCETLALSLRTINALSLSSYHKLMVKTIGIDTDLYKQYSTNWTRVMEISANKVRQLKELRQNGQLTPTQESSYANQAIERQLSDDSVSQFESESLIMGLLQAGVDTTGNYLTWRILHVAMHPEVQENIYRELQTVVDPATGRLTSDSISPSTTPYLFACVRESHRCASSALVIPIKKFETEITVHGETLPPNSVVALDAYSTGVDPELVEDPTEFRPERFSKQAVSARKGTPAEILDHPFFSGPFSQGARRCPGSRVADMETHVLIAQLVLDWKMDVPSLKHWTECPYGQDTLTVPRLPPLTFTARK